MLARRIKRMLPNMSAPQNSARRKDGEEAAWFLPMEGLDAPLQVWFFCFSWVHFGFLALLSSGWLFSFLVFLRFRGSITKNVKFTFQVCPVLLVHTSPPLTFLLTASTTTSETLTASMWHWFCNPPKPVFFFFFLVSYYLLSFYSVPRISKHFLLRATVNRFSFAGHIVSVATTPLYYWIMKVTGPSTIHKQIRCACVSIKLYLHIEAMGRIWPEGQM